MFTMTQWSGAEKRNTNVEPDMKPGGKEMENQPEAKNMMAMFERMLQEQRAVVTIFSYGVKGNKPRMCNIAHALRK